jgi:secondary thiamine-phosphate synthase enzyme
MGVFYLKMKKDSLDLMTSRRVEIMDITKQLEELVISSGVSEGLVNVFTRHSTSGIVINENESRLLGDLLDILESLVPENDDYGHDTIDNNADSHLRAMILGGSQTIPITNSKLDLGTWQSVFFVELDGPRNRTIKITILG